MRLTATGYAKLNLALHVRGRLGDGRHQIETIFAFCEDGDALIVQSAGELSLKVIGPYAAGLSAGEDNLVLRAAHALRDACGTSNGAAFTLDKHLPVAAGIGGGSADAAAALRLLIQLWNLAPNGAAAVAPSLGADVPACLLSQTALGEGAGDELAVIDLPDVAGTPALLVNPGIALATADVFAGWDGEDLGPLEDWREGRNDLEPAAIALVPRIADVLAFFHAQPGAATVRMSGSGATCFALFGDEDERDGAARACPPHWWKLATRLR